MAPPSDQSPAGERPLIATRDTSHEIDTLLCSLQRIATGVHEGVEATRRKTSSRASHIFDFTQVESLARRVALLKRMHDELGRMTTQIAQYGRTAHALLQEELQTMEGYIKNVSTISMAAAAPAVPAPSAANTAATSMVAAMGTPWRDAALSGYMPGGPTVGGPVVGGKEESASTPPVKNIILGEGISLGAIVVPGTLNTIQEVMCAITLPELYYIPQWDHFAIRVGPVVFHGNIGHIYPSDGQIQRCPERVKECRNRGECPSLRGRGRCTYYHEPADMPKGVVSHDVRNFIAASWLYVPQASANNARYGSRRFGSRETIASDLQGISAAEARRFLAQTAHDIICSLILAKYGAL